MRIAIAAPDSMSGSVGDNSKRTSATMPRAAGPAASAGYAESETDTDGRERFGDHDPYNLTRQRPNAMRMPISRCRLATAERDGAVNADRREDARGQQTDRASRASQACALRSATRLLLVFRPHHTRWRQPRRGGADLRLKKRPTAPSGVDDVRIRNVFAGALFSCRYEQWSIEGRLSAYTCV